MEHEPIVYLDTESEIRTQTKIQQEPIILPPSKVKQDRLPNLPPTPSIIKTNTEPDDNGYELVVILQDQSQHKIDQWILEQDNFDSISRLSFQSVPTTNAKQRQITKEVPIQDQTYYIQAMTGDRAFEFIIEPSQSRLGKWKLTSASSSLAFRLGETKDYINRLIGFRYDPLMIPILIDEGKVYKFIIYHQDAL